MNVRPIDLPEVRTEMIAGLLSRFTEERQRLALQDPRNHRGMRPGANPLGAHARALADAALFYVSDEMSGLVASAARSLPYFGLQPPDLPSAVGVMVFASPIFLADETDDYQSVVALSWTPDTFEGNPAIWLNWWSDLDAVSDALSWCDNDRMELRRITGRLLSSTGAHFMFTTGDQEVSSDGSIFFFMSALKTAWLLMQQPLASVDEAQFDRATRRRLLREQHREPDPVRVISLRRTRASGIGSDSGREYHHQWLVRGHWRQQWYPGRNVHRPVWIAPHIKGPEGAPLIGGEKVYALRR